MRLRLEAALDRTDVDPRPAIAASLVDADRLGAIIDEVLTLARAGQTASAVPIDLGAARRAVPGVGRAPGTARDTACTSGEGLRTSSSPAAGSAATPAITAKVRK
jgi:hypothetical protein